MSLEFKWEPTNLPHKLESILAVPGRLLGMMPIIKILAETLLKGQSWLALKLFILVEQI